jgi:hypothetical protein
MDDNMQAIAAEVAKGLIAGAVATWTMEKVTGFFWTHEDAQARARYEEVSEGRYPPARMAEKVEGILNLDLPDEKHMMLAQGLHWAYGLGAGTAYALLRRRLPPAAAGQGLLFGALFSLVGDELFTSVAGLAERPTAYPWQAHARGLAGHLAFGLVADTALDLMDAAA